MKEDPTLADVFDRYVREPRRAIGRAKEQVLLANLVAPIGEMQCSRIVSQTYVQFVQSLKVKPQTVENDMLCLAARVHVARPAWGYPLDERQRVDARTVLKKLGATGTSRQRDRRPTLDELNRIIEHFAEIRTRRRTAHLCRR
ncbi:hypothetical protein [Paraburkholderia sp. UYCP14C]|uniref:hypothetical protein n=1 Tax=Paraburkholderia sp. UYCP14C TaxID=2511130 RepID=UPI001B7D6192|nr:hypothetical protein [Paraburkholderia sp. UYCP14C]